MNFILFVMLLIAILGLTSASTMHRGAKGAVAGGAVGAIAGHKLQKHHDKKKGK